MPYVSIEICAGGGGQAFGLEQAGFHHVALVENDKHACSTLRHNRPQWNVLEMDVREFSAVPFWGKVDLLAGGVPCPPFSRAGQQLGRDDERDLFPEMLRLVGECRPKAILIENVAGLLDREFEEYRNEIVTKLQRLGYICEWQRLNASDFGVPQLRARVNLIALRPQYFPYFSWPIPLETPAPTVGEALFEEMASNGWEGSAQWREIANQIAPTLVGGSKKHGGPDLGPTRAKRQWASLGVDGLGIADEPPGPGFEGMPRLTVRMAAIIQGFKPDEWEICGRKTNAYRQVGNAFPPPVAQAVGECIHSALKAVDEIEEVVLEETGS